MDRQVISFVAALALLIGSVGFVVAQNLSSSDTVETSPVTLLAPAQTTVTTAALAPGTTRQTLPPTPSSEVFLYAADGGCTPGTTRLPDGQYHGSIIINPDRTMTFNLKCLFLAADLPDDFDELFSDRFPGQTFPATGADLIDPVAIDRTVRFTRFSEFIIDGGLYIGDEASLYYTNRGATPFDATILIEQGVASSIAEIADAEVNPG
jgi:hypothetical protein